MGDTFLFDYWAHLSFLALEKYPRRLDLDGNRHGFSGCGIDWAIRVPRLVVTFKSHAIDGGFIRRFGADFGEYAA